MKFLFSILLLTFLFSCSDEPKLNEKLSEPIKKEFLNHEILNDSIHYRIKEYDKNNHVLRNICVFNKEELIGEQLIYKVQKKEILDEGYNITSKKTYQVIAQDLLEIQDITYHHYDYKIESADTNFCRVKVKNDGNIEVIEFYN